MGFYKPLFIVSEKNKQKLAAKKHLFQWEIFSSGQFVMLIYLYFTLIFFLINNPLLSFLATLYCGTNIGFPKLCLAFHANVVSCRRGDLLMHPMDSTARKESWTHRKY